PPRVFQRGGVERGCIAGRMQLEFHRGLLTAMVVFGMAGSASAQQITDARIRELIKEATSQTGRPPVAADVRQPATGESRPVVRLRLDDAVKFALARNLDISVQRLNPPIKDIAIASISSVYHPSLTSTVGHASPRGTPT